MTQVWIFAVLAICLWSGVSEASSCPARGRFPNENELNCRGYTMCLSGAPGIYTQLDLSCPENFVYSHIDNQCTNVTGYQCYPQYNCTTQGLFPGDMDQNCTAYVACVQGLTQIATARLVQCPENTLYSPLKEACVNSTVFTCASDNLPPVDNLPNVLDALPSQEADNSNANSAVNLCFTYALLVTLMFSLIV